MSEIDKSVKTSRRYRRFSFEQKKQMLLEAQTPGSSMSAVARKYGLSPSQLYQWRRAMEDGGNEGLKNNEKLVPESELKKAQARIKELERALGRKTVDNDILREAVKYGQKKKWIPPMPLPGEDDGL